MIHLILPTFNKKIREKIIAINNGFEQLNGDMQKVDIDYIQKNRGINNASNTYTMTDLSPPTNIFHILEVLKEKNQLNSIYKELLIYTPIETSPIHIKYIGNNLSHYSLNRSHYLNFKDSELIYSEIVINNEEYKTKLEDNTVSSNKILFFKHNRKKLEQAYEIIEKEFKKSYLYYNTFIEVFHKNNPDYLQQWIDLNSKDIFFFSLYNMPEELQLTALFKYRENHGNIYYSMFSNSMEALTTSFEKHINYLDNYDPNNRLASISTFIKARTVKNDYLNEKIKSAIEKVEFYYSLQENTIHKIRKHKTNKI